jgi:hypothetical protein
MGAIISFFSAFLYGVVFGVALTLYVTLYVLCDPRKTGEEHPTDSENRTLQTDILKKKDKITGSDVIRLKEVIEKLDEFNNPPVNKELQLFTSYYISKASGAADAKIPDVNESKMRTIIEHITINKKEKEFQEDIAEMKDHQKQIRNLTNFYGDLHKCLLSFSREISKLSNQAKSNMNKSQLEKSEDLIINNWWQALLIYLDYLSADQENLATHIHDELAAHSNHIQEELVVVEKKLGAEASKLFGHIRDNRSLFDNKLKEREKNQEKLRAFSEKGSATNSDEYNKRLARLRISEEGLQQQTKKLFSVQKDFYQSVPKLHLDKQMIMIKSLVESHGQLFQLADQFDKTQNYNRLLAKRLRNQLTNAAVSLLQMIREENSLRSSDLKVGLSAVSKVGDTNGVGHEEGLQTVLEGLLHHCQQELLIQQEDAAASLLMKEAVSGPNSPESTPRSLGDKESPTNPAVGGGVVGGGALGAKRACGNGKLNMFGEDTASLAASNPAHLMHLPRVFNQAIGIETCVWFNALNARIYRDVCNSKYFYNWFRAKMNHMLNKGKKPGFMDKLEVLDIQFGELPPLISGVPPANCSLWVMCA